MKHNRDTIKFQFSVENFCKGNPLAIPYEDTHYILGIDEAGRGSIAGAMIYCGSVVTLGDHDKMVMTGVADSKVLTFERRAEIASKLQNISSFVTFLLPLSAETISETMLGLSGATLNTLSHRAAIAIIQQASEFCSGRLVGVFVDTVGPPESYERMLCTHFPQLRIKVCPRADSHFPIVSAASIMAKTERDSSVLKKNLLDCSVGNGYPSDPLACHFVRTSLHRFFAYRSGKEGRVIRHSWRPVIELVAEKCISIQFEADTRGEEEKISTYGKKQLKLAFISGNNRLLEERRDPVMEYTLLMKNVDDLDL